MVRKRLVLLAVVGKGRNLGGNIYITTGSTRSAVGVVFLCRRIVAVAVCFALAEPTTRTTVAIAIAVVVVVAIASSLALVGGCQGQLLGPLLGLLLDLCLDGEPCPALQCQAFLGGHRGS